MPIKRNGLVMGGLQLVFNSAPPSSLVDDGFVEVTAVAAELFFGVSPTSTVLRNQASVRIRNRASAIRALPAEQLTPRQMAILKHLGGTKTYAEIARDVAFSESTVKKEVGRIFDYLDVYSRAAAYDAALERGLI